MPPCSHEWPSVPWFSPRHYEHPPRHVCTRWAPCDQWWRNPIFRGPRSWYHPMRKDGRHEAFPDLSRLSNQLMRRTCCRGWCAVPLHRTKRLEGPAGRASTGGHGDLSFMTSAPQHHGAFWHFPPRRARSLKARAHHATHPPPRAWESIGYVSVVITTWLSNRTCGSSCSFSPS